MISMSKPRVISLFSGAGGLDYGFEAAGFDTAVAFEMDRDCCETLRNNRRWPVLEGNIFDVPTGGMPSRQGGSAEGPGGCPHRRSALPAVLEGGLLGRGGSPTPC